MGMKTHMRKLAERISDDAVFRVEFRAGTYDSPESVVHDDSWAAWMHNPILRTIATARSRKDAITALEKMRAHTTSAIRRLRKGK